jgi:hypothetical protein
MQHAFATTLVISLLLTANAVNADVGPRAPCPPGTHHQYLYGHNCVKNGYHLERGPQGGVHEVEDGKVYQDTATPAPSASATFATPPPTATATATASALSSPPSSIPSASAVDAESPASPSVVAPPQQRGCTCGMPGLKEENVGAGFVLTTMLFVAGRRIRLHRQTRKMNRRRD